MRRTGEEYVSQHAWRNASQSSCPLHPKGGCGFARHGTYELLSPPETRIARWYCPQGQRSYSLLPDCLAARLPGTLAEIEAVVGSVEQDKSLEAACVDLRLEIELPGVLRWVRRRVQAVHATLHLLKGILPDFFEKCELTLAAFSQRLGVVEVLSALRQIAALYLAFLPSPFGLCPRRPGDGEQGQPHQHPAGPDPPALFV